MKTFKEWRTLKESVEDEALSDALIDWTEVQKKPHNVDEQLARIAKKNNITVDELKDAIRKSPKHGSGQATDWR